MISTLFQTAGPEQLPSIGWVDLHSHLLPGLDDGPVNWEQTLALCREMIQQGITHVAATPHLFGPYAQPDRIDTISQRIRELAQRLEELCFPLTVYQGADMRVGEPLTQALADHGVLPLGLHGQYVLIDPTGALPQSLPDLRDTGYRGVLAKPECNRDIQQLGPSPLVDWTDQGGVLLVAASSLLGASGGTAKRLAWRILESELPTIVGSDTHDLGYRPPRISEAVEAISSRLGRETALRVCRETPWSLIADTQPAYAYHPVQTPGRSSNFRATAVSAR